MRNSILKTALWFSLGFAALLITACGMDSSSTGTTSGAFLHSAIGTSSQSGTGTLQVALTDAVDPNLKEVVISIREVQLIPTDQDSESDGGLPLIAFESPRVVNVLDLAYQQELLGEATVPAGTYNQLRLILEPNKKGEQPANYVRFQDDSMAALTTPGSQSSGLKIKGKFTVSSDEITSMVFDLDPAKAIFKAGKNKWMLKPTGIRLCQVENVLPQYGAITGSVTAGETVPAGAIVSASPVGQDQPVATSPVNPEDGSFRVMLSPGTYYLKIEADGFEPFTSDPETFEVIVGEDTDAGVFNLTSLAQQNDAATGDAITGFVMSGNSMVSDAMVAVIEEGQILPSTINPVNPVDGSFRIVLPPGTYYLEIEAPGYITYPSFPDSYEVVAGYDTDAGIFYLSAATQRY